MNLLLKYKHNTKTAVVVVKYGELVAFVSSKKNVGKKARQRIEVDQNRMRLYVTIVTKQNKSKMCA